MDDIANKIDQIGEVLGVEDDTVEGEYKDHNFTVDKDGKVTIGDKLTGAKPTAEITILTEGENLEEVELQVVAKTEEGEIESLQPVNGAVLKTENSVSDKIYTVTSNGVYKFEIIGTNGRKAIVKKEVSSSVLEIEAESILEGLSRVNTSGLMKMKVKGETPDKPDGEEITYRLNVINKSGNVVLNAQEDDETIEDLKAEGITVDKTNKIYSFGKTQDISDGSTYAQNTVVLKVDGNLTIDEGVTATALGSNYGGPKGLIIYCTGTITNNGTISMTARGAKAEGENVYLLKNKNTEVNKTFEYIPEIGAGGGNGFNVNGWGPATGSKGTDGIERQTGGGAGGSARDVIPIGDCSANSGVGSSGTSYSGGTGGGGCDTSGHSQRHPSGGTGSKNGGSGGSGIGESTSSGAGNPTGGTGGLLIIYARNIQNNKDILSNGSQSPEARTRGGASGGGSINIFYLGSYTNSGTVNADGPASGSGGKGGNGTVTSGKIVNGTFKQDT